MPSLTTDLLTPDMNKSFGSSDTSPSRNTFGAGCHEVLEPSPGPLTESNDMHPSRFIALVLVAVVACTAAAAQKGKGKGKGKGPEKDKDTVVGAIWHYELKRNGEFLTG